MRAAFRTALGSHFLAIGGRELLVQARVEDAAITFDTAEELLALLAQDTEREPAVEALRKAYREAGVSPVGDNGKPRTLKLTAWIAHGGDGPNQNGDAFLAEDLQECVRQGLFRAPYFGMVDFNHDFESYGVWYDAKYAYDPVAGAYGILAEGMIFAWRYTELADRMLAMQSRLGHIDVSMACLPGHLEYATSDEGREYTILRNPTFFTTSVLDVDPADEAARALGTEDTTQPTEEREILLTVSALDPDLTEEAPLPTEDSMTIEELVEAFRQVVAEENQTQFAPMVEAFTALPEVRGALEQVTASFTEATERVTALEAQVTELETAAQEAQVAQEATTAALTEANTELERLRAFEAEVISEREAAQLTARREARLAELSEAARTALAAKGEEVQEKLVSRWVAMEEEEWTVIRDSLNVAKTEAKGRYETATEQEGTLAAGAGETGKTKFKIDRYV